MSTHVPIVFDSQHKIRMDRHKNSVRRRRKPKFSRVNFLVRHSADNVTSAGSADPKLVVGRVENLFIPSFDRFE